jgi:hypothetical protein
LAPEVIVSILFPLLTHFVGAYNALACFYQIKIPWDLTFFPKCHSFEYEKFQTSPSLDLMK